MKLLEDLIVARREKGLTQERLAALVGTDRQGIHRLERGVGSFELLNKVMAALDYHITGLARGATLPEQLVNRRSKLKLSIAEVARRAGVTAATIARLEQGEASVASVIKVLAALGTSKMGRKKPTYTIVTPLAAGEKDKRFTPIGLLRAFEAVWGPIDLDPCGHPESPVRAQRRILQSEGGDGLRDEWTGNFVFMNPPFSAATSWLKRANEMYAAGKAKVIVGLIPAKTDSAYFQDHIVPVCDVGFLRGRLQFGRGAGNEADTRKSAPFATMLIIWGAAEREIEHFRSLRPSVWMMRPRNPEVEDGAHMLRTLEPA